MICFTTIEMKSKFHYSCFGLMSRDITSGQGYLDVLSPSPNENEKFRFSNEKLFLIFLLLNDLTLKGSHVSSFTCVSIKHQKLYDSRTLINS